MYNSFRQIWNHRKILFPTAMSDIRTKYAGSVLGLFWLILYPLLLLTAYSFVYIFIFRIRLQQVSTLDYVLVIFAGLIPFLGFSEGLSTTTVSVTSNASLIKNTLFPIDIIPVKAVFVSQCTEVAGLGLLLIAVITTGKLSWSVFWVIPIWLLQVMMGIGFGWLLSALNVLLRDVQSFVPIISMLLMMVSPIAYTPDMIPEKLRMIMKLNPLYYYITSYQLCLIQGETPPLSNFLMMGGISFVLFFVGYWFFKKLKPVFSDYV